MKLDCYYFSESLLNEIIIDCFLDVQYDFDLLCEEDLHIRKSMRYLFTN